MNLTPDFDTVHRSPTHFAYLEARGPFAQTAAPLWKELPQHLSHIPQPSIREYLGLSGIDYETSGDDAMIYQAGVSLSSETAELPAKLQHRVVPEGNYARFLLTGPYSQIGQAFDFAFKTIAEKKTGLRQEFCIEVYLNDPRTTPESELKTELLVPIV